MYSCITFYLYGISFMFGSINEQTCAQLSGTTQWRTKHGKQNIQNKKLLKIKLIYFYLK
jgi:hypothetical protein